MRRFLALLLSSSALVAPAKMVWADEVVWPQVGGWGQAWEASIPASAPAVPSPLAPAARPKTQAVPHTARSPEDATVNTLSGKNDDTDRQISLTADEVSDDRDLGIVTARGAVEAFQGRRHLKADTLTYNVKHDVIAASGNVILVEPTGEVTKADYMEISDDFANGLARKIRYLAADKSRVTSQSMTRAGDNRTDFDKATYTPCEPCKEHPERSPMWKVDAQQITHNQEEQSVEYRDAWLSVSGVPVAYTPYMSTSDPTVKRSSGFLSPLFAGSSSVGESITTPYYLVLGPQEDITIYPRWMLTQMLHTNTSDTADEAVLNRLNLGIQERWTGENSIGNNLFIITEDPNTHKVRGMINAKAAMDLDETWRAGFNVLRESDDTYALMYNYTIPADRPWLGSRAYTEGFWQKDYAIIESFAFQGITPGTDASTQSPWVMPHAAFTHISSPGKWDDTWTLTTDSLTYTREEGTSATRLDNSIAWNLPYRDGLGEDWKFTSSFRADGYHSDDYSTYGSSFAGRAIPQFAVNWKYPFANDSTKFPQTISPLGMLAVSPNGGNPVHIPNEDSIDYELDDNNIFQPNRMAGLDHVEGGVRGAYGLRWTGYTRHGSIFIQIAQGWRGHDDQSFDNITGFNGSFSDYLGSLKVDPGGNFRFIDRVRLDRDTLSAKRNEATIIAGPEALKGSISYYYFAANTSDTVNLAPDANVISTVPTTANPATTSPFGTQQQIYLTLESQFTRYWSFGGTYQDALESSNGGPLGWRTHFAYNDECFAFIGSVNRNYTYQGNYLQGITFAVNLVLKTFGQLPQTIYSD